MAITRDTKGEDVAELKEGVEKAKEGLKSKRLKSDSEPEPKPKRRRGRPKKDAK